MDLLLAVWLREGEPLLAGEGRVLDGPAVLHTIDVPVLASKRVTTMPGDVHIGWVMYEYIAMESTASS